MSQAPISVPQSFTIARSADSSGSLNDFDIVDLNEIFSDDFFPPDLDFGLFYQTDPDLVECQSSFSGQTDPFARIPTLRMRPTDGAIQSGTKIQIAPIPPSQPVLPEPNKNARRPIGKRTPGMKGIKSEAKGDSSMRSSVGYNGDKSDDEEFEEEGDDEEDGFEYNNTSKKSKRGVRHEDFAPPDPNDLDEVQRVERRERNREHAKRSRVRKRLMLGTLQERLRILRSENTKLRRVVVEKISDHASQILDKCTTEESDLLNDAPVTMDDDIGRLKPSAMTTKIGGDFMDSKIPTGFQSAPRNKRLLMEPDFRLIQALVKSQTNFVLSDPSLPDNPIVYCSDGFCKLTGYKRQAVLGRNCRFLQGPGTDQNAVDIIRQGVAVGADISVCLLNYKADGTPFWNQFFVAALRDSDGSIVNYIGVQCEVNSIPIHALKDRVKKIKLPDGTY